VLNFIATDLELYKIFRIRPVSFFGTHYSSTETTITDQFDMQQYTAAQKLQ